MAVPDPISLPTIPVNKTDYRSDIENDCFTKIVDAYGESFTVEKYYKTANKQIYEDCVNKVQSGVPAVLLRTTRENTRDASPDESLDNKFAVIEIFFAVPVKIEKNIKNVDRYVYTMHYLVRELLRANPLFGLPKNRRRPFIYLGNRDIFRDDDLDILLSEYNVNYIAL